MTTLEFSEATGVTIRRLQYWDEEGVFCPARRDHHYFRDYDQSQISDAIRLLSASRAGIQVKRAKNLLRQPWMKAMRLNRPTVIEGILVVPE